MGTWTAVLALSVLLSDAGSAAALDLTSFSALLTGFQEVPPVSTGGKARLGLRIGPDSLTYSLQLDGLDQPSFPEQLFEQSGFAKEPEFARGLRGKGPQNSSVLLVDAAGRVAERGGMGPRRALQVTLPHDG